jgi:acyl carrier protein
MDRKLAESTMRELAGLLRLEAREIVGSAHLARDLGVDSLNAADLIVAIEQRTGARIVEGREAEVANAERVDDLIGRLIQVVK